MSWVITESRCTCSPSPFLAPRQVLPSAAIATEDNLPRPAPAPGSSPGSRSGASAYAWSISHAPIAASRTAASIPVRTRQSVTLEGPAAGLARTHPAYASASTGSGTSAIQPAIAVNERIPATTAPAHNASTAASG